MHGSASSSLSLGRGCSARLRLIERKDQPLDPAQTLVPHQGEGVAAPGDLTVTEVAHHCGFVHTGRFAIAYRRAFGESPSTTLRRNPRHSRRPPLPTR